MRPRPSAGRAAAARASARASRPCALPVASFAALLALTRCAPAPPPARPAVERAAPAPSAAAPRDSLVAGRPGPWQSPALRLELLLPDRSGWRERPDPGGVRVLEHAASQSQLLLRLWYASERMDRARCEQQARLLGRLPDLSRVDEESLASPEGFDTAVRVAVAPSAEGSGVAGSLVAFGARGKQCFAFVYTTMARARDAEETVAERLAVMRARSLGRAVVERDTDELPRAPHPALGPAIESR